MTRLLDIFFSIVGLLVLSPVFVIISLAVVINSKGSILFKQKRVGKNNKNFTLFKFRSMARGADKNGLLTIGNNDMRITKIGKFIRKYKLDELPQLFNVLTGNMSIVGPRPEVRKYVDLYNNEQLKVLSVRPGITDYASIKYSNENELLAKSSDPEKLYIENIMPEKIKLNMNYINNYTIKNYFLIISLTIIKIF